MILGLLALALFCACRQADIRTVTIKAPGLKNQQCEGIVSNVLTRQDGVRPESIRFSPGAVTVTYDSMKVAIKNLEYAMAGVGFAANEIPAQQKAYEALPPECK